MSWKPPSGSSRNASNHSRRPSWNTGSRPAAFASSRTVGGAGPPPTSSSSSSSRVRSSSLDRRGGDVAAVRSRRPPLGDAASRGDDVASGRCPAADPSEGRATGHVRRMSATASLTNVHHFAEEEQRVRRQQRTTQLSAGAAAGDRHSRSAVDVATASFGRPARLQQRAPGCPVAAASAAVSNGGARRHMSGAVLAADHQTQHAHKPSSSTDVRNPKRANADARRRRSVPSSTTSNVTSANSKMTSSSSGLRFPAQHSAADDVPPARQLERSTASATWDGTMGGGNDDRGGWLYSQDSTSLPDHSDGEDDDDDDVIRRDSNVAARRATEESAIGGRAAQHGHRSVTAATTATPSSRPARRHDIEHATTTTATTTTTAHDRVHESGARGGSCLPTTEGDVQCRESRPATWTIPLGNASRADDPESEVPHRTPGYKSSATGAANTHQHDQRLHHHSTNSSGRGAHITDLQQEIKSLRCDNEHLAAELTKFRELYVGLTSTAGTADAAPDVQDHRRSNLLKAQVFQLERQVLLLSTALSKRAGVVQESANTMQQVVDVLSHHQTQSSNATGHASTAAAAAAAMATRPATASHSSGMTTAPKGVFIPRKEFDDILHSACHTHARITKGVESATAPELERALLFMSPFLKTTKPSAWSSGAPSRGFGSDVDVTTDCASSRCVQPTILDVCSGSLEHLSLKHIGQLETELYQLYGDLLQLRTILKTSFSHRPPTAALATRSPTPSRSLASRGATSSSRCDGALTTRVLNAPETAALDDGHRPATGKRQDASSRRVAAAGRLNMENDGLPAAESAAPLLSSSSSVLASPFVHAHAGERLDGACSRLGTACQHLLGLSLLVPSAPFPALDKQDIHMAEWSTDSVLAQLPPNIRNRQEVRNQLDALVKSVKYALLMKDKEVSSAESELLYYRRCQELTGDYAQSYLFKVSEQLSDFEDKISASVAVPLGVVLEAYESLKQTPSEESLRTFVSVFKDHSDTLGDAIQSLDTLDSGTSGLSALTSQFSSAVSAARKEHTTLWNGHLAGSK